MCDNYDVSGFVFGLRCRFALESRKDSLENLLSRKTHQSALSFIPLIDFPFLETVIFLFSRKRRNEFTKHKFSSSFPSLTLFHFHFALFCT